MKRILRVFLVEILALYLVSTITSGLVFEKGWQSLMLAGLSLGTAAFLVRPAINILLLPLNLLTFGVFKFLTNAITLFLVDLILKEFTVGSFLFLGLKTELFEIPSFGIASPLSYIAFSFVISFITSLLYWLVS